MRFSFINSACLLPLLLTGCAILKTSNTITLFNGQDLAGWREPHKQWQVAKSVSLLPDDHHLFQIEPGTGIFVNGPKGTVPNLKTEAEFGDMQLHVEFVVSSNSNSGVYVQGRYEVQILDSWGVTDLHYGDCGGIYQRWKNEKGYDGHAPKLNASRRPGEWQAFDITFRAPRFDVAGRKYENGRFIKVLHNGKVIHENVEVTGPTRSPAYDNEKPLGPIMLQGDHGPVAFRNLRITPLSLP